MATITYKCPNCGGGLTFDPSSQKFKCGFCLSEFTQAQLDEMSPDAASDREETPGEASAQAAGAAGSDQEASAKAAGAAGDAGASGQAAGAQAGSGQGASGQAAGAQAGSAVVYTCPSCGAEIITDQTTAATYCYYCHNPVVLEGKLSGKYLPDRIIPFQYDKDKATELFLRYVKGKRFVPKAFFNKEQIEKLTGVYYPFWVYDCEVEGVEQARGEKVRVWMSGDMEYRETSVFRVDREGTVHVQNITRNALKESDRRLIDAVRPFRTEEAVDFTMPYLQGFVAQRRDVEATEVAQELQAQAKALARQAVLSSVGGYTAVQPVREDFRPVKEKWQYLLLPVWVLTYGALSGQRYYFAMNGQTGEIRGKLPIAYGKLAMWSGILGGVFMAFGLLASYFFF